jgi:adenylate cyclase
MIRSIKWIFGKVPIMVSLSLLAIAVTIKGGQYGFIVQLQHLVFDAYQQQFPRDYEPSGVKIIDIDDESLERLGQWPWPRQVVGQLVSRLAELGSGPIAFDIVFSEPDRTSPVHLKELWGAKGALLAQLETLPDHDTVLGEAFAQAYVVGGFILNHAESERMPKRPYGMSFVGMSGADPTQHVMQHYSGAILNLPELEAPADGNGFFNNIPDSDGIIRRIPLTLAANDQMYFSLGMEALRVAQGASSYIVKMAGASGEESFGTDSGITAIRNGHFEIPTDANGRMLMYYTPFKPERYIPVWKVLEPDFDASQVEGNILLVGTSAPGLLDLRSTPLNPSLPGVEVHAQALEQVLLGTYLYRPDVMVGAEIVVMVVGGIIMMLIMARLTAVWGAMFMVFMLSAALGGSVYAYLEHGYLIEPVSGVMTILMLYLSESLRRYMQSEAERKKVRGAFSQYMSPDLVRELEKNPKKLTLGGEMRDMTLLFADIRGFTTISEQFGPQELTEFINAFLTPMTEVILKRKGTIDKYMGDCIIAFWNAPLEVRHHPKQGCLSALEMLEAVRLMNIERKAAAEQDGTTYLPINVGVGVNSGECCVGNMGSQQRFDYSVLGDDVNLASRLEGQSKTYGVGVVIGEKTQAQVSDLATIELDLLKVKGKTEAVRIFALMGDETLADNAEFNKLKELWSKTLVAYRDQQWDEAENFMKLCETACAKLGVFSIETLCELYRERMAAYRISAPAKDWDGVFTATSK